MKINNKKAVSAVVATVLIILITIAAVAIIWGAIIPLIQNQLSSNTIACLSVSNEMDIDSDATCYKDIWYCNSTNKCDSSSPPIATCSDNNRYSYIQLYDENGVSSCSYSTPGAEVSIVATRRQGDFNLTGISAKVFAGGKTYSTDILGTITTGGQVLLKTNSTNFVNPSKIYYTVKIREGSKDSECGPIPARDQTAIKC
jgi:hypothetical protein